MKTNRTLLRLGAALLAVLCLSACTSGEMKKRQTAAENYLKTLSEQTGIPDSFHIVGRSLPDNAAAAQFEVSSQTYHDSFFVYVEPDGRISDCYYSLMLKETAEETILSLLRQITGEPAVKASVSLLKSSAAALKAQPFRTLKEFYAALETAGFPPLLRVSLQPSSLGNGLSEENKNAILRALREEGYYATFYPEGGSDGTVWYDILPNGIWETRRTGADGGKMLDRKEFPLD